MHLPIYKKSIEPIKREITSINYTVTSVCNYKCVNCCVGSPWDPNVQHHTWEYFEHSAKYFYGINRIHLTGGEPTLHPDFKTIAPKFKELFNCELLTIETNGYGLKKFPELFNIFDRVYISRYDPKLIKGSRDNSKIISDFTEYYKGHNKPEIIVGNVDHIPRTKRGNNICHRGTSETVQYAGGLLYSCCTASGVDGAVGIPLTENWREEIEKVYIPCENCFFAEP